MSDHLGRRSRNNGIFCAGPSARWQSNNDLVSSLLALNHRNRRWLHGLVNSIRDRHRHVLGRSQASFRHSRPDRSVRVCNSNSRLIWSTFLNAHSLETSRSLSKELGPIVEIARPEHTTKSIGAGGW
jgi:hypothetical protein